MEKLRPWIREIEGEVVKFKHNESFGVKFKPNVPEAEIKRRLVWVREQWTEEVKSMGYNVEQHIYEEIFLVVEGRGTTEVWLEDGGKKHIF